ncbi:MAG: aminotransferase class I/II-fold pyridoxal phosphate-dependent enzyme [Nitrosopumilus sp.]|nr:aminotransferase class I/II-fold pyridoxal phosphate-dependent enzyme [Nitrosopumilus sp.]
MASNHKLDFIDSELEKLKKQNIYRKLRYGKSNGAYITINNKKLLNLCSNDYLGIVTADVQTNQLQSSSRLVSGNDESYKKLEEILAKHKSQEKSLVYPTGYMANLGAITAIAKKGDLILSDELNHASIIESCKLSDARIIVYKHNDVQDLEKKLKLKGKNKFVITEGVFSMDGDLSPLKEITELSEKHNVITIVDDAHGDFVIGKDGKGTPNYFNVEKKIDLYISSLSKGLGSFGGYVASKNNVVDLCINKSKSFIYTSALPSFLIEYSTKRFKSNREKQKEKLEKNTNQLIKGLKEIGFEIFSTTHIIPIVIGNEKNAMKFGKFLMDNGVFAQPIRYPTVPKNQARLRISVTSWLTNKDIEKSLVIFEKAFRKFR